MWLPPSRSDVDETKPLIAKLAQNRLVTAIVNYEKTNAECFEKETVLSKNIFDAIGLTEEDKNAALLYFYIRNQRVCNEPAGVELIKATLLARELELPGYSPLGDPGAHKVLFSLGLYAMELRREARYQLIPEEKRRQIENLPEIYHVFSLIKLEKQE